MFGFQFGTQNWWDCPFEVKLMDEDLQGIPGIRRKPLPFQVMLVDATTGATPEDMFRDIADNVCGVS